MSEDEKAKAERAEAERVEAARRGHFESVLEDYPGYFELPFPFLDRHMKVWWKLAISPVETLSEYEYAYYTCDWNEAVELITKYGKWTVDGVPEGDLDTDNVPSDVKSWVMMAASLYIVPKLPISLQRKKFGTM